MSSHVLYEYEDGGDYLLKIQACSQQEDDSAYAGYMEVSIDGRTCCLPPSERQAAAQALAGDEWHVVPKWTERENDRLKRENDDLHKQLHDAEVQATQPDHPEPVDPASDPRSYDNLLNALLKDVGEEITALRRLVDDEDSSCPARSLRAERLAVFEQMRRLLDIYRDWEW